MSVAETQSQDQQRIQLADQWVRAALHVADKTNNVIAKKLIHDYLQNYSVGQETAKGTRLVAGSTKPAIVIAPVIDDDKDINEATQDILAEGAALAANYFEGTPGIINVDGHSKISSNWRGLILLHELSHAAYYDSQTYRGDDYLDRGKWIEEVEVFMYEHSLMTQLGGEQYQQYIVDQVARFLDEFDDKDIETKGAVIPRSLRDADTLDEVFGKSRSSREISIRATVVWLHVVYLMFDTKYGDDSLRDKVGVTKALYSQS